MRELMFWVPQNGSIGMGLSIISYNGQVHFGLIVDSKLIADPESVVSRFASEFEKLLLPTLMEEWTDTLCSEDAAATLAYYAGLENAAAVPAFCVTPRRQTNLTRSSPVISSKSLPVKRRAAVALLATKVNPEKKEPTAGFSAELERFRSNQGMRQGS